MIFIPIGILIAAIVSFVIGNKQWKSGTEITNVPRNGGQILQLMLKTGSLGHQSGQMFSELSFFCWLSVFSFGCN